MVTVAKTTPNKTAEIIPVIIRNNERIVVLQNVVVEISEAMRRATLIGEGKRSGLFIIAAAIAQRPIQKNVADILRIN